jgi:hypothetical protein
MNRKMTASTLAALGFLFQAACGAAPDTGATGDPTGELVDFLSRPYVEDLAETALRIERANMPAEAGGPDRLYRGDFLFGGQMLQDPTCNWTLQMGNPPNQQQTSGGLNTWQLGTWKLTWGAGNSNPYNYAAYWYPTESGGNGNFLVLSRSGSTLWETDTWSSGSYTVVQQTDANVVMYVSGGSVPWASNQVSEGWGDMCNHPDYPNLVGMKTWMRPHKDLWGADYASGATTLGNCGSWCATDANCHSFTYYGGWCYLKNGQPSESNLTNAFSGRKLSGNYTWY